MGRSAISMVNQEHNCAKIHHFEWEDQLFLWLITNMTMENHNF